MAVLYGDEQDRQELYQALVEHNVSFAGKDKISYASGADRVSFLSFRVSKGLEFPLVAIMGGRIVEQAKTDIEAAKLLYVAMTRATEHLIMTVSGNEA